VVLPAIPLERAHHPDAWKREYRDRPGGRSYQPIPEILESRLKGVVSDFGDSFDRIFHHPGFSRKIRARLAPRIRWRPRRQAVKIANPV
jgi:hypothetical protein